VLDLPRHRSSLIRQEEDDTEDDAEDDTEYNSEDNAEEIPLQDPTDGAQEVLSRSQKHKVKFGDDGHLIKASIVDVDCSG